MLTALFAVSAFAQTQTTGKVAAIDSGAFSDEKQGITKYVNAFNQLNKEFQPKQAELQSLSDKIKTAVGEIGKLQNSTVPTAPQTLQAKREEAERMQRDLKFKTEEAQAAFQKRQTELLGPVMRDIYKVVQEFAKKNGYLMIFDLARLGDNGAIMALDETADVTKAFVAYYNARPAGAATATPK